MVGPKPYTEPDGGLLATRKLLGLSGFNHKSINGYQIIIFFLIYYIFNFTNNWSDAVLLLIYIYIMRACMHAGLC